MKTIEEKINFLIENSEYDCCEDAYEYWAKNEWKDSVSDDTNLNRFDDWCENYEEQ